MNFKKIWNRIFIFVQSKMRNIFLNLFTFTTFQNHSFESVVLKSSYKIGFEKMFLQTCHAIYWVAHNDLNPQIVRSCCRCTKSLVNTISFYTNFTNTHFQKVPIPHLTLNVLWGQPIKLIQVASNSELHENQ